MPSGLQIPPCFPLTHHFPVVPEIFNVVRVFYEDIYQDPPTIQAKRWAAGISLMVYVYEYTRGCTQLNWEGTVTEVIPLMCLTGNTRLSGRL